MEQMQPVTSLHVKSVIAAPSSGSQALIGKALVIRGVAWSGDAGPVTAVDVSVDGGRTWRPSTLSPEPAHPVRLAPVGVPMDAVAGSLLHDLGSSARCCRKYATVGSRMESFGILMERGPSRRRECCQGALCSNPGERDVQFQRHASRRAQECLLDLPRRRCHSSAAPHTGAVGSGNQQNDRLGCEGEGRGSGWVAGLFVCQLWSRSAGSLASASPHPTRNSYARCGTREINIDNRRTS